MTDYRVSHFDRGPSYDSSLAAEPFSRYMNHWEATHLRKLVPALFPSQAPRHLDFACGTGRITEIVAPMARETVGVDVSDSMLEEARAKLPSVEFRKADLTKESVELAPFDLVTSFRFVGNAQQELRVAALNAVHRLLKPSGYLIVNNHRSPTSIAARLSRLTGWDPDMDLTHSLLTSTLHGCGFTVVRTIPIAAWVWRFKLLSNIDEHSGRSRFLESAFSSSWLSSLALDAIIVAQKTA